jgi:hypothetical protein
LRSKKKTLKSKTEEEEEVPKRRETETETEGRWGGREEERARSNTTECGAKDAASDEQANAHAQDHTKRTTISD